ncbi:SusD-like starch-binding protein associating with outer membrane [Lacibacter cauensis]|uniref:SusD-like starch-binding protein associating with outer membrane n=1 Tax=Lacibacter cauensis TaxID=510947 RepID=A0A562SKE2_9BACT|nr:RagB/SusD family nutrient uptake outer membrane protein [Lacibacter cauensis]TWI81464.1 SusD-like starch-binding protein associating with outer membrane [Lacibacter cauensis]
MKILKYSMILIAAGSMFTACNKQLDLKNPQAIGNDLAFATDANVKQVLVGAYDALSSGNLYGGNIQIFGDLMAASGELNWTGTFNTYREVYGNSILTTNPIILNMWASGYSTINIANNVIANVNKVNAADRNKVKGEALFIRGAVLFELTRFFAKAYNDGNPATNPGVIVRTTPTTGFSDVDFPARNTVAECYTQILADLNEAVSLLPNKNGVYANKVAAATILARVHLQMGNYAAARDAANTGLTAAAGNFSTVGTYAAAFNTSAYTSEDVFSIVVNDQDGTNNCHTFYSVPPFGGRDGDIVILQAHLNLYPAVDQRKALFYDFAGDWRSGKWRDVFKNVKVIRLAELYLIRAECNQRLSTTVGDTPLNDINRLRTRAGAPTFVTVTLADILLERRLELAHEGFRIHDAKRLGETVNGRPAFDNRAVFPIPFREMNTNPNLVQNPGYTN